MSSPILEWPAFSPIRSLPSAKIRCERGIWGKAPGAATDYRWMARSDGLDTRDLPEQLTLGSEDQPPVKAPLWLRQGDRYCAAVIYPSPAWDAAGRSGFLEKQMLAWTRPSGIPAALGALLLFDQAASFDAKVWSSYSEDKRWQDAGFFLELDAEELAPFRGKLEALVDRGVEELHASVERKSLGDLYAQILSGRMPAYLTGLEAPLSPLALAVLLLPLPRAIADTISLAGWISSSRASLADLGRRWDVIVVPPHLAEAAGRQVLTEEWRDKGWALAEALLELEPEMALILPEAPPQSAETPPPSRPPAEPPVALHAPPLSPLEAMRPGARIALPAPPKNAPGCLEELHAFACTVEARWPDLDRWSRNPISELAPIHETLFPSWITTLQQQKPGHVDDDQWKVKLDVLRSAALVLRPGADTVRSVGAFESGRVPELLFALCVSPGLLAEMGKDNLRNALRKSLSCAANPWTRRLEQALIEWPPVKRKPWVKALIQDELKAVGKS
jgi:hypothetical protein